MANFTITQQTSPDKPTVKSNHGYLNSQLFTFEVSSFTKEFFDPQGGSYSTVTLKSIPSVLQLKLSGANATVGAQFLASNSANLTFELNPKYAIHNGVLYEFTKDIDAIIADQDLLGYKLHHNTNGRLVFINPNNLNDITIVQGTQIPNLDLQLTFTTTSSVSGFESNIATFSIIPWENVNLKPDYIYDDQGNPVTGITVTGDAVKTITITLEDGTTYTGTFNDNDTVTTITVTDTNTNPTRHEVAQVNASSIYETVTALVTPTLSGNILTLKFLNENNITQSVTVDLSGIVTNDINVQDMTWNAATNILTLNETDGTPHTIDLSEFSIGVTVNPDGTADITQEGVTKITISKVGRTGDYNDLLNLPAEQDNKLTVYKIHINELSAAPTEANIKDLISEWFTNQGIVKSEIETLAWEIDETSNSVTFSIGAEQQLIIDDVAPTVSASSGNPPRAPLTMFKSQSPTGVINFRWPASESTNVDSYSVRLYRYDASNGWTYTEDTGYINVGITTTHSFSGLDDTGMYYVEVIASNEFGDSEVMSMWTAPGAVLAPIIEITDIGPDHVTIDWTGGEGAEFKLWYEDSTGTQTVIQTFATGSGTFTHSNLQGGSHGYFFVAHKTAGQDLPKDYGYGQNAYLGAIYVSPSGDDANDGSQTNPLRTIPAVNTFIEKLHGVEVYFEGGHSFAGTLEIISPWCTVSSYGTGRATISSWTNESGIKCTNVHDITIEEINVSGAGISSSAEYGIKMIADEDNNRKFPNINILNCDVTGYNNSGIALLGQNVSAGFENVLIEGVKVYECGHYGIISRGVFDYQKTTYAHHNVTVRNCEAYYIRGDADYTAGHSGNGITLSDVQVGLIENCVAHDNAESNNWNGGGAAGIWFWDSDQVTIQHCTAYNISGGLTGLDGAGFDFDGGVTNGIMQYNHAYNCHSGGAIVGQFEWARPMNNVHIRYNVFANNSLDNNGAGINVFSGDTNMNNVYIYNNTVHQGAAKDALHYVVWAGGSIGTVYAYNNLLWGDVPSPASFTMANNWLKTDGDPLLVDTSDPSVPAGFKLQDTSPLLNVGGDHTATIGDIGTLDYFGNPNLVGSTYDIGAHENQLTAPATAPTNFVKTASAASQLSTSWDAVPDATSYSLRLWHYDGSWNVVEDGTFTTSNTVYTFTGLVDGRTYGVELKAVNAAGESPSADLYVGAGTILAPDVMEVSDTTASSLTVSWSGGSGDTYELYRGDEATETEQVISSGAYSPAGQSFEDTTLTVDSGYYYYIKVLKTGGGEAWGSSTYGTIGTIHVSETGIDVETEGVTQYPYGTITSPFKTIAKLNSYPVHAGATVRFDGGYTYAGDIPIQNSGTTINSYGTGKAVISSGATSAIVGRNLDNITIDNLELAGTLSISENVHGIELTSDLAANAKLPNITITNCDIHDFAYSGIYLDGNNVSTGFDNVIIDNCKIWNIYYAGILTRGVFDYQKTTYAHSNITITNVECYDIVGHADMDATNTGQGIQISDAQHVLIENCIARDSAHNGRGGAIGIWAWDSDDVVIQFCEAYNISSGIDNKDGAGFDLDGGCTNSIVQYCYAHDNEGGGVIIGNFDWARPMNNNHIRYNILVNNASRGGEGLGLFCGGNTTMDNTFLYNNTVFFDDTTRPAVGHTLWSGGSLGTVHIYNNLLRGTIDVPATGITMATNWNVADGDPMLVDTTSALADGFKIQNTSPLRNAGGDYTATLGNIGTQDYFGNPTLNGAAYDIGAHENNSI